MKNETRQILEMALHLPVADLGYFRGGFLIRLEYIMLLKLPIILSSNSFIFHLLFSLDDV